MLQYWMESGNNNYLRQWCHSFTAMVSRCPQARFRKLWTSWYAQEFYVLKNIFFVSLNILKLSETRPLFVINIFKYTRNGLFTDHVTPHRQSDTFGRPCITYSFIINWFCLSLSHSFCNKFNILLFHWSFKVHLIISIIVLKCKSDYVYKCIYDFQFVFYKSEWLKIIVATT